MLLKQSLDTLCNSEKCTMVIIIHAWATNISIWCIQSVSFMTVVTNTCFIIIATINAVMNIVVVTVFTMVNWYPYFAFVACVWWAALKGLPQWAASDVCVCVCVRRGRFQTHWRDSLWKSHRPALKSAKKFLKNWRSAWKERVSLSEWRNN